jgi:hypothetical protein
MFPVLGRAASPRHRRVKFRRDRMEIPLLSLRLACVGLLSALGWVHLHLWQIGYRHIPTIGPVVSGSRSGFGDYRGRPVGVAQSFCRSFRVRNGRGHSGRPDRKHQRRPVRVIEPSRDRQGDHDRQ